MIQSPHSFHAVSIEPQGGCVIHPDAVFRRDHLMVFWRRAEASQIVETDWESGAAQHAAVHH